MNSTIYQQSSPGFLSRNRYMIVRWWPTGNHLHIRLSGLSSLTRNSDVIIGRSNIIQHNNTQRSRNHSFDVSIFSILNRTRHAIGNDGSGSRPSALYRFQQGDGDEVVSLRCFWTASPFSRRKQPAIKRISIMITTVVLKVKFRKSHIFK